MARDDERQGGAARQLRSILLIGLCLALLALFALWRMDNPRVERARMGVVDALSPMAQSVAEPLNFLSEMTVDFENFVRVYQQNDELRREIQRLRAWRESALQLEQENARLRALNHVRLAPSLGYVTGEIIGDSGGPFLATGLANVGFRDGVEDGAAVMDGSGLVGRVVGLGRKAARVLYVTDYSSRIPVLIRPSGRRAILSGDGPRAPRLDFLEDPEGVRPGDRVVTSGDGEVFPPDLPVGIAIVGPDGAPRARLAADMERLEFVRILRYKPDTEIDQPGGLIVHPGAKAATRPAPGEGQGGMGGDPNDPAAQEGATPAPAPVPALPDGVEDLRGTLEPGDRPETHPQTPPSQAGVRVAILERAERMPPATGLGLAPAAGGRARVAEETR